MSDHLPERDSLPRITLSDLRYAVDGREILGGITQDVAPGEILCVMGLSGAGKSTILRCIAGLVSAAGLSPEIRKPAHYCLSDRVAAPLAALPGVSTRISTRPALQELVALIGLDATQSPLS